MTSISEYKFGIPRKELFISFGKIERENKEK